LPRRKPKYYIVISKVVMHEFNKDPRTSSSFHGLDGKINQV
jgi:hypothetical protein